MLKPFWSKFDTGRCLGGFLVPPWDTFGPRPQKNTTNQHTYSFLDLIFGYLFSSSVLCFPLHFPSTYWDVLVEPESQTCFKIVSQSDPKPIPNHTFPQNGKPRFDMLSTVWEPHGAVQGGSQKPSKKQACKKTHTISNISKHVQKWCPKRPNM